MLQSWVRFVLHVLSIHSAKKTYVVQMLREEIQSSFISTCCTLGFNVTVTQLYRGQSCYMRPPMTGEHSPSTKTLRDKVWVIGKTGRTGRVFSQGVSALRKLLGAVTCHRPLNPFCLESKFKKKNYIPNKSASLNDYHTAKHRCQEARSRHGNTSAGLCS